jgi:5-methylthioribose kinase
MVDATIVNVPVPFSFQSYATVVRFRPAEELEPRANRHFAVCALARIDGTSPVDYLPEEPNREAVRKLGRKVLETRPKRWSEVLRMVEAACGRVGP